MRRKPFDIIVVKENVSNVSVLLSKLDRNLLQLVVAKVQCAQLPRVGEKISRQVCDFISTEENVGQVCAFVEPFRFQRLEIVVAGIDEDHTFIRRQIYVY